MITRFVKCMFRALAVVSLLAFFATCAMWMRSHRVADDFRWGEHEIRMGPGMGEYVRGDEHNTLTIVPMEYAIQSWQRSGGITSDSGYVVFNRELFGGNGQVPTIDAGHLTRPPCGSRPAWPRLLRAIGSRAVSWTGPSAAFSYYADHRGHSVHVLVHYGYLAFLAALLPSIEVLVLIRHLYGARKEPAARPCLGCGYDLRATPERCPECGKLAKLRA